MRGATALTDATAMKKEGITSHDFAMYSAHSFEYFFTKIDPRPDARMVIIMDMGGLTLKKMCSFDTLNLLKTACDVSTGV